MLLCKCNSAIKTHLKITQNKAYHFVKQLYCFSEWEGLIIDNNYNTKQQWWNYSTI